mgnify:CR=1 FL=1
MVQKYLAIAEMFALGGHLGFAEYAVQVIRYLGELSELEVLEKQRRWSGMQMVSGLLKLMFSSKPTASTETLFETMEAKSSAPAKPMPRSTRSRKGGPGGGALVGRQTHG